MSLGWPFDGGSAAPAGFATQPTPPAPQMDPTPTESPAQTPPSPRLATTTAHFYKWNAQANEYQRIGSRQFTDSFHVFCQRAADGSVQVGANHACIPSVDQVSIDFESGIVAVLTGKLAHLRGVARTAALSPEDRKRIARRAGRASAKKRARKSEISN